MIVPKTWQFSYDFTRKKNNETIVSRVRGSICYYPARATTTTYIYDATQSDSSSIFITFSCQCCCDIEFECNAICGRHKQLCAWQSGRQTGGKRGRDMNVLPPDYFENLVMILE